MRSFLFILLFLAIGSVAARSGASLAELEQRLERYAAHQTRLEGQLTEVAQRIARLKRQPTSVRRDYQLQQSLQASQTIAESQRCVIWPCWPQQ